MKKWLESWGCFMGFLFGKKSGLSYRGERSLRVESLESRQLLTAVGWAGASLATADALCGANGVTLSNADETIDLSTADFAEGQTPSWNLSGKGFDSYILKASSTIVEESGLTVYRVGLYGLKGEEATDLGTFDDIGAKATVTITGDSSVSEKIGITADAMSLLGVININGGNVQDSVTILGTDGGDTFSINSETKTEKTPIYTQNPYASLLDVYKNLYGESSSVYQQMKKIYDQAYARLQTLTRTTQVTAQIVEMTGGASVSMTGTKEIAIEAGSGDDTFAVSALTSSYRLLGGEGNDTLDFSKVRSVNIDMGLTSAQYAVVGQLGQVTLNRDMETVIGTASADRITASSDGSTIVGNGGRDYVYLKGGANQVTLNGSCQSVIISGGGDYNVTIENGDYSTINALLATSESKVTLNASGRGVTLQGGLGEINGVLNGDSVSINALRAKNVTANVTGNFVKIFAGSGDDKIEATGNYNSVYTYAGNDEIRLNGSYNTTMAGAGDDVVIVQDGNSGASGSNFIYGEAGNDSLWTAQSTGRNYLYAGAGNDVLVGGSGNDYIYGMSGRNVLIGLGGSDQIVGGCGSDLLIASRPVNFVGLEEKTEEEIRALMTNLWNAWAVEEDMDKTLNILGQESVADDSRDWVFRGGGVENVIFVNSHADNDFNNGLTLDPFLDKVFDD